MSRTNSAMLVAVVLLWVSGPAVSEEGELWDSWHVDQDLFAPGNEDRNYTMGVRFNWYGEKAARSSLSTLPLLRRIDKALGFDYAPDKALPAVSLGNSTFTPDDLAAREPITEDRPYASLLYTGTSVVVAADDDRAVAHSARGSKLLFGVLGLPLSDWVQTWIHQRNRAMTGNDTPVDPEGWHNQISDGGEPTAMYQRSWMRRLIDPDMARPRFDAAGICDVSIGYYSGFSCGAVAKLWGRSDDESAYVPFWIMLDEINPQGDGNPSLTSGMRYSTMRMVAGEARKPPAPFNEQPRANSGRWIPEWYVLAGVRGRAIAYNELMQGGFRSSEHEFSGSDLERVVWEGAIGLNLTFRNRSRVMLTCSQRGPEHKRAERRSHRWCGLNYYMKPH